MFNAMTRVKAATGRFSEYMKRYGRGLLSVRRRVRWFYLVLLSRRKSVVFPGLGRVNVTGMRLWIVFTAFIVVMIIRVS